jgi:hypothetical protein
MAPLSAAHVWLVGAFHVVLVLGKRARILGGRRSIDKDFAREFSTVAGSAGSVEKRCSGDPLVASPKNA